jgi:hypothetical protein
LKDCQRPQPTPSPFDTHKEAGLAAGTVCFVECSMVKASSKIKER